MNEKMTKNPFDASRMQEVIRTSGNLSAPGKDEWINSILKLERESESKLMIALMHVIVEAG
jgi:hypothetical protein